MFISDSLEITDSVLAFDEIMEEIEIGKYLKPEQTSNTGRPGYNRVNMLKTILFGFMDTGYVSLRELQDRCKVNLRYMYLMDNQTPSYRAFGYFINDELLDSVERMKFPMYKKETHDEKYRDNPFRAVNFKTDEDGDLVCPNNRKFHLAYRRAVKGNKYGRQEEIYKCEGCSGCPCMLTNARRHLTTRR